MKKKPPRKIEANEEPPDGLSVFRSAHPIKNADPKDHKPSNLSKEEFEELQRKIAADCIRGRIDA